MGWKAASTPTALRLDDKIIRKPEEIANAQLEHFRNKIKKLTDKLQRVPDDPLNYLKRALERWGRRSEQIEEFVIQPVGRPVIRDLLSKMGVSKSFGHDGLDGQSMRLITDHIVTPLHHITNLSISTGVFANKWKVGRVIPLWKGKGKDKFDPDSYRQITLLPVISKLVEKVVQQQLGNFMETQRLWNPNLHGYRKNLSTTTALGELTDAIFTASDENLISVAMSIDESAAFDCVRHKILIQKLRLYKFHQSSIQWMSSYLQFRSSYIAIGAHKSRMDWMKSGVPQGSILGPSLFNVYVNELPDLANDF